ncbi:hypothetical protein ACEYW6_26245 [Nostoc sp. UIC 10607]|uniref:hypothetical protein n=1 Tax=unclassified Nostoc TaxID=2593658 RepID=UPI0018C4D80F|nr:hypothetical protein [Nostoc sp. NZL]MBG1241891.1 hypothetical protein [Nostoc sp. NZL]
MTVSTKLQQFLKSIKEAPAQIINYISSAAARIFAPKDDDYPDTGVQPFEGDIPDEKRKL